VLDPDRKKMSKSKGNVVTPMHLLDQYGADAVRYWSLSAKLGTDTAFDEKVLKVGRRLVVKLFNASKFVLAQSGPEAPVTRALDLGFLARLREVVEGATAALDAFEHAAALDLIERFFWSGFTDSYLELVKTRARSETDAEGRGSALAALRLGLGTLLRLLAPFLPFICEEAWSWRFAADTGSRSIHRAPWPGAHDFTGMAADADAAAVFGSAAAFLEAVHRAKTAAGGTVGRTLAELKVAAHPRSAALLERCRDDALAAARVEAFGCESRDGLAEDVFEVVEARLGEPRADR
jgi:valyl-tRNA synthetase